MRYKMILGLETHIELKTKQKMFCGCSANYFGKGPNLNTCPVCLALPGALPVPNKEAIRWTILIARALNCKINLESFFERKHYFYPDLPKGYQISQYLKPFGYDGFLEINGLKVQIERVHLEEDTGKLVHGSEENSHESYVDYNRSGVPLVEIVTRPVVESSMDAVSYLKALQQLVKYLNVSDADMEKGSMRCEPNISLVEEAKWNRERKLPNYKVEVKNINSFRFVKKAVDYEIERQAMLLSAGETPQQETRRYLESTGKTAGMRSKENAHDYRYFPEPDIPPFIFEASYLKEIEEQLASSELPSKRLAKLESMGLTRVTAIVLVENKELGDKFIKVVESNPELDPKNLANLLVNRKLDSKLPEAEIASQAKDLLTKKSLGASELTSVIKSVLKEQPKAISDYHEGRANSLQFLLGQVLRIVGRQVEVKTVLEELNTQLSLLK